MEFSYKAKDAQGTVVEGTLEAPDRFVAAKELRERGETPISVAEVAAGGDFSARFTKFFAKITLREKIVFTHNLSGMLTAGLSLYRALEVLKKQNKNPALEEVLSGLLVSINQGGTLSDGLTKYPKVFSTLFVSMVRAGEESGNLSGALKEIGSSLEKSYNLSHKIKSAMMYPMVIVSAILIIGTLMLIFVVPTLTKIFKETGGTLPAPTRFIIAISDAASGHPFLFMGGLILIFGGLYALATAKKLKRFKDKMVLRLPAIKVIVQEVNAARTARTLSSLLAAGVEMTRALEITKEVLQNVYYKEIIEKASAIVQKGGTLSSLFIAENKLYPVMLGEMVAVGEETGALTQMLTDVATYYEEEVDTKTKNLSTIVEPVLMMFIGGAVGFFAIAMIAPMYSVLNNI